MGRLTLLAFSARGVFIFSTFIIQDCTTNDKKAFSPGLKCKAGDALSIKVEDDFFKQITRLTLLIFWRIIAPRLG